MKASIFWGSALLLAASPVYAALLIMPTPLKTAVKPAMTVKLNGVLQPTGINSLVLSNAAAIKLGKALFWDAAIGSDGMACASCHFKAGADSRAINQVNPGFTHNPDLSNTSHSYEALPSGTIGPHSQLRISDFPLFQFGAQLPHDPLEPVDPLGFPQPPKFAADVIDDVVSSAGTLNGVYISSPLGTNDDKCVSRAKDEAYRDNLNVRRVEPRNTPTAINATFNVRNFWDGRANRIFNGVNPFGPRDTNAKIWRKTGVVPVAVKLEVDNASLASQAVGPVLSDLEMSCHGRTFQDVGAKVVGRVPLAKQKVLNTDSVLGTLVLNNRIKPSIKYRTLIQQTFHPSLWTGKTPGNIPLEQANFALFFGLAVQAYEDTLRSNAAKYDLIPRTLQDFTPPGAIAPIAKAPLPVRLPDGTFKGLTASESRGLDIFMGQISPLNPALINPNTGAALNVPEKNGRCILCHNGPEFTSAAFTALAKAPATVRILPGAGVVPEASGEPMPFAPGPANQPILPDVGRPVFDPTQQFGTYDLGFYDIGVTPLDYDSGLGGNDPFGNPLSFSKQWENAFNNGMPCPISPLGKAAGALCKPSLVSGIVDTFSVNINFVDTTGAPFTMDPSFSPAKIAGAFKTPSLRNVELTAPYFHNGSARTLEEALSVYNNGGLFKNPSLHPEIRALGLTPDDVNDIKNFLLTLTDPRVKYEKAPFDHPSLAIPHGHKKDPGTGFLVAAGSSNDADDDLLQLPAVGRAGLAVAPLSFDDYLEP